MNEENVAIIENLQNQLKSVRLHLGFSTQELADCIGVTRQTVNNLEAGKTKLSESQAISILAIIDRCFNVESYEHHMIKELLGINSFSSDSSSMLEIWFDSLKIKHKSNNKDENHYELYNFLSDFNVFVFYDFLMNPASIDILKGLLPFIQKKGKTIILPRVHAIKLISLSEHGTEEESAHSKKVMSYFVQLKEERLFQIMGKEEDSFRNDEELLMYIASSRISYNGISVFSQSIKKINVDYGIESSVTIYHINSEGILEKNIENQEVYDFRKLLESAKDDFCI